VDIALAPFFNLGTIRVFCYLQAPYELFGLWTPARSSLTSRFFVENFSALDEKINQVMARAGERSSREKFLPNYPQPCRRMCFFLRLRRRAYAGVLSPATRFLLS